jgi:hypothetical protein
MAGTCAGGVAGTLRSGSELPLVAGPVPADDGGMFSVHCAGHGSDVLLSASCVEAIVNTPTGILVRWRCPCGTRGTLRTGRARR